MASQKGLGKGLGALLGDFAEEPQEKSAYQSLPIYKVEPNPDQPRKDFDPEELENLAESIRVHGLIQPLTVREMPTGYYQIIAGERRWRAARLAKLSEVPVVVIDADDRKAMELALIENLQRQDLNPVEEALGYKSLMEDYGLTQEEAASRVGKSRPAVANALRLLHLPDTIAQMVAGGELSAGHARALLAFATEEEQLDAAAAAVDKSLSVRDLERMAKASRAPRKEKEAPALFSRPPFFEEVELSLTEHMGRRVKVTPLKAGDKSGGTLTIEFFDPGDLQDLAARLAPES